MAGQLLERGPAVHELMGGRLRVRGDHPRLRRIADGTRREEENRRDEIHDAKHVLGTKQAIRQESDGQRREHAADGGGRVDPTEFDRREVEPAFDRRGHEIRGQRDDPRPDGEPLPR